MPQLFIGGTWRDAADGATRDIHCPADGRHVATVSEATEQDALDAVRAARRAFDQGPWRRTTSTERAALLHRFADRLESEKDKVAELESLDTGKRFVESQIDVDDIVAVFRHFAALGTGRGQLLRAEAE
jgi:betaine-aldehyde dehydrogenase